MGKGKVSFLWFFCLLIISLVCSGLFFRSSAQALASLAEDNHLLLALKFIEFVNEEGRPWVERSEIETILGSINQIYSQCDLSFSIGKYETVNPKSKGLPFSPQSLDEMKSFRKPFWESDHLVIIHTAAWDHSHIGPAHAWTAMPGDSPLGVVIDGRVGKFAGIIAHELGHYLNLYHVKNEQNVMNPVIYKKSTELTQAQCNSIRRAALAYHQSALRKSPSVSRL